MENVPKLASISLGILIPISFVVYVDWVKKVSEKKILGLNNNHANNISGHQRTIEYELQTKQSYRIEELKYYLIYSIVYFILLIAILYVIGPYINFDLIKIYFSSEYNKPFSEKIQKTLLVQLINIILYSGLLIQFILKIESIYKKPKFLFFMENIYGPFIEEFIYRGILYSMFKYSGYNGILSAIFSSLTFSVSHFRHICDIYFTADQLPRILFQCFYTLLFAFYSCYAYEYSGTILSAILLHMVCNTLQLPRFEYLSKNGISKVKKIIITAIYIIGIVGWGTMILRFH